MQLLNILKKIVIDSQIYVSLMGTFLAAFFMLEQNAFRFPTFLLIFITYFSGYVYTKYQYSGIFRKVLFVNAVAGIFCIFLLVQNHDIDRLYRWGFIVVLGLLYNSFFLEKIIRKVPLIKIFYVGLVWSLVNAWLSIPHFNGAIFFITFFFVSALVLPFDIRDMNHDQISTFPKVIGIQNTKYLGYFLIAIASILAIAFLRFDFAVAFYMSSVVSYIFIYFSENRRDDVYFSFGVETCCGLPLLFLMILEYI